MAAILANPAVISLLIQEAPVLVEDIMALFKKHPALTPDTLATVAQVVYATNADTRTTVAADEAAHPVVALGPVSVPPLNPAP
jgi:hypothetical protein